MQLVVVRREGVLEGGGARGRNLVLPPLRRQLPVRPAGQMLRGARRPHLQPAAVAFGKACPGYRHLVNGVAVLRQNGSG